MNLRAYAQLARPANLVTAVADIVAGAAVAGVLTDPPLGAGATLGWLALATVGLYGGGVVLNDVFDARLDAVERPERPIPSGRVSRGAAARFGALLLALGVAAATAHAPLSGAIALAVTALAVLYDAAGKHHPFLGPLNMGLCRGGNLLLGMSALPAGLATNYPLAALPVVYIAAITAVSRGEVHGGDPRALNVGVALYGAVFFALAALRYFTPFAVGSAAPLALAFGALVFPPLWRARRDPTPARVGQAVKWGVLSLILLDATLTAGFAGVGYGLAVAALLPASIGLARAFAVT